MPTRIQLRRTKGWRKPDGAISVARPTKWGNPYIVGTELDVEPAWACGHDVGLRVDAELAVALFRKYALEVWGVEKIREDLGGKTLMCWCKIGEPCHADLLLKWANAPQWILEGFVPLQTQAEADRAYLLRKQNLRER